MILHPRARHYGVLFAALLQGCAPSPTALPPADEVFAHYFRAIGGRDRLLAVSTRQMWGTYTEGALTARTDIAWQRPQLRRVNVYAPGFDYSEGYDGRTWEYNFQSQRLVVDTGAAADAGRRGAEFDESFIDYARKGHRVLVLGADSVLGRPSLLQPHRFVEREAGSGRLLNTLQWDSVRSNLPIAPQTLSRPQLQ